MSMFPAYATGSTLGGGESAAESEKATTLTQWLENNSFPLDNAQIKEVQEAATATKSSETTSSSSNSVSDSDSTKSQEKNRKRKQKHKKKKKQKRATVEPSPIQFQGDEEYYVDKTPAKMYKNMNTLHKPACPRYRRRFQRCLGTNFWKTPGQAAKRYYVKPLNRDSVSAPNLLPLNEEEYNKQLSSCNRCIMESSSDLQSWLNLIDLQNRNPFKWSRLLLAEKKLELIQRALLHHTRSEPLYRLYINIVNATYPSFEVSKMLDRLLAKDPYNYTLWTAQIMTTQGTMARCEVPEVLRIYARCMQKMHHNAQKLADNAEAARTSDAVMLKLFHNCALFLRQAGLMEQFFALIKLALDLNVSPVLFDDFVSSEEDQRTLIDYEEVVLQTGLPMNEIWLRIEKLRQCYNFLPCPPNTKSSDPQRIVFNEDICHYIYPLKERDSSLYLLLLIFRLLKLPFVQCEGLSERFNTRVEHIGDSDAIEDVLAICLRRNYALPSLQHEQFLASVYELAKEMAVSPTFLSNSIAHENYTRCVSELLLKSAAAYAGIDQRRRLILLCLWCRFQRLLLVLSRLSGKPDAQSKQFQGRDKFKELLGQPANRNLMLLYTEFAIYEYERSSQNLKAVSGIFKNIMSSYKANEVDQAEKCHLHLVYAEILVGQGARDEALQVLASYALTSCEPQTEQFSAAKLLLAFQRIKDELNALVDVERNAEVMLLEQYLLPDHTVSLIKMRALMQYLLGHKLEALAQLDKLKQTFNKESTAPRQRFLREHVHETYVVLLQLPSNNCQVSMALLSKQVFEALAEFPRNLFLMQQCGLLGTSVPWYKLRANLLRQTPSVAAVALLIATARHRFLQSINSQPAVQPWLMTLAGPSDRQHAEEIVRNRILDIFRMLTTNVGASQLHQYSALQRNALFWRFYLRCLSDQKTSFDTTLKCLLTALDECPWNKSLYLDGATYVPQESSHLQDLIIEKHLRIYALPEELEILREH